MLLSPASTSTSLPGSQGFWGKFKPKSKQQEAADKQAQMALARQRLLTLSFGDMETIRMLPNTYAELDAVARDWVKPPPDAPFGLRVPVEFASLHAARLVSGPYIYLTSEDSFQIAVSGVQGLRVEIVADGPPPEEEAPPPPPPPVLEMDATFSLELVPGQQVQLETIVSSDELDMARMEDGTTVDGSFWGKLDIVHDGDTHKMDFSGTRLQNTEISPDFLVNTRVMTKLAVAARPIAAKCEINLLTPQTHFCDVILSFSSFWRPGITWPPAEQQAEDKTKWFLRVNPGGALEHFESQMVTTTLYYEAIPEASMIEPDQFITPRNGYAMSFRDFVPHLMNVLDQLGMSLYARSNFMARHISSFAVHKNIAYRFLSPNKIVAAFDISITAPPPCFFTRLFLIWRGLSDDDVGIFAGAGEKEANQANWREVTGWSEEAKDTQIFRVLETSILEVS